MGNDTHNKVPALSAGTPRRGAQTDCATWTARTSHFSRREGQFPFNLERQQDTSVSRMASPISCTSQIVQCVAAFTGRESRTQDQPKG